MFRWWVTCALIGGLSVGSACHEGAAFDDGQTPGSAGSATAGQSGLDAGAATAASPDANSASVGQPGLNGQWRALPVRSQVEFERGDVGGEGIQLLHGIARAANPDVIYLSHDAGPTWVSLNNGGDWTARRGKGLPFATGNSIAVDPANYRTVYKVVSSSWKNLPKFEGLYKSTDGGDTWTPSLLEPTNYKSATRMAKYNIAIDPTSIANGQAQQLYVAFQGNGLFRSSDAGDTWRKVADLESHNTVYQVVLHPDPADQTVFVATSSGLLAGSRGSNLQRLTSLPVGAVSSIAIHPHDPRVLYATVLGAANSESGLWRSDDGGLTFVPMVTDQPYIRVHMNSGFPDSLILIGLRKTAHSLVSDDGGQTWNKIGKVAHGPLAWRSVGTWHEQINSSITAISFDPRDPHAAIGNSKAFMVKTTNLIDWTDSSKMFTGASAVWGAGSVRFSQDPAEMFLFCHDIGTLVTGNQGKWFDWLGSGTTRLFHTGKLPHGSTLNADIHPTDADIIVATAGNLFDVRLVRTDDRGKTWSVVSPPGKQANSYFFVGIHQQNPQYVYAGDKRSIDGGLTFQNVDFGAFYKRKNPFSILGMSRTNSDVVYAVDRNQRIILRSNDRAETWEHYGEPGWRLSHSGPRTLLVLHPNNHDLLFTQGSDGDLASFDGKDWKPSFGVLALADGEQVNNQVHSLAIDPNDAKVLYVSMYADGVVPVWGSTDSGATWEPLADNLPYFGGNQLTVNPHTSELIFTSNMGTWIKRPAHSSHPATFWENAEPRPAF